MQNNLCRSVGHQEAGGHMAIVALFLGDSDYSSDTKEYYILVILSFQGFQSTSQNAVLYSVNKIHLSTVLQYDWQIYFYSCYSSPWTSPPFCVIAILFASAASYSHYSSHAHHPVLPVCVVLMPFEAELLGGVVSSGHLTANFSTNRTLLLHSGHSCQHPVVSQTALTVPHIPAGFVTQINHSCKLLFYNLHTFIDTYIHTYIHSQIHVLSALKGKQIKWPGNSLSDENTITACIYNSWGVSTNSSHCKSPVYKMLYYDYKAWIIKDMTLLNAAIHKGQCPSK